MHPFLRGSRSYRDRRDARYEASHARGARVPVYCSGLRRVRLLARPTLATSAAEVSPTGHASSPRWEHEVVRAEGATRRRLVGIARSQHMTWTSYLAISDGSSADSPHFHGRAFESLDSPRLQARVVSEVAASSAERRGRLPCVLMTIRGLRTESRRVRHAPHPPRWVPLPQPERPLPLASARRPRVGCCDPNLSEFNFPSPRASQRGADGPERPRGRPGAPPGPPRLEGVTVYRSRQLVGLTPAESLRRESAGKRKGLRPCALRSPVHSKS